MLMEGWRSPIPGRPPPMKSKPFGLRWLGVALRSGCASASRNADVRLDVWFCGEFEP